MENWNLGVLPPIPSTGSWRAPGEQASVLLEPEAWFGSWLHGC